jgi:peptidyl-prolyl cis-trans isomerase C
MRLALRWIALALLLSVQGSSVWALGSNPGSAVRINGHEISNERFFAFYKEYQRGKGVAVGARGDQLEMLVRMRQEAMDLLIEQELVRDAAEKHGIEVTEEELDAAIAEVRESFKTDREFVARLETEGFTEDEYRVHVKRMIGAKKYLDQIREQHLEVGDAELEAYYKDNEYRLTLPEMVRVRHILRSWRPLGKPDDRAALYELMQPILDEARSGADFAELATKHSEDSTRINGGEIGFIKRGEMPPVFESAAFALKPGEVSEIVETPFGLHIIYLEERKAARLMPLEEIRDQLREHIQLENMEKAVSQEKARLREAAEIEILIPLSRDS